MIDLDVTHAWRIFNAALAIVAFVLVARGASSRWRRYTTRMRLFALSLLALLFVSAETSIELAIDGVAPGLRTGLATAACAWCVYAEIATSNGYERRDGD